MKKLLRPICYFIGHRNITWRLASKRIVNDKKGMRVLYDIYDATVCARCKKEKMVFTKKGKTQVQRIVYQGLTFDQAVIFVPSLKNTQ